MEIKVILSICFIFLSSLSFAQERAIEIEGDTIWINTVGIAEIQQKNEARQEGMPKSILEEHLELENMRKTDFSEITESPLPNIPVHILTGGRFDMPEKFRSKEYDNEALFRSKMRHRVARWTDVIQSVDKGMLFYSGDAGHFVHYDDPELVISSIKIALHDYEKIKEKK